MPPDPKELIRERLNIADVVGELVALKPAGRGQMKGLCPFHSEKTPSFHVHLDRGFYYCFGCHAKGDVFDFVMQTQGVAFGDALRLLGERAGVAVGHPGPKDGHRRDLFDVNALALGYFRSSLDGEALGYLRRRGLTDASIESFELGFAPDGWDGLLRHALTRGVRDDDLLAVGLLSENERGRRYDRFRNRVIFPIKDGMGRVVGFAGRVLDDSLPKYLNTPETELFRKAELLYGLDRARPAIRKSGEAIVVEGYMDVIALHQTGFGNAVAALGAALTEPQAEQLARLDAKCVYLAFDADEAGQRAVLSGLDQAVGRRLLVRAVQVPHGKDPADAVLEGHADAFREALGAGLSEVEFRFGGCSSASTPAPSRGSAASSRSSLRCSCRATCSIRSLRRCAGWSSITSGWTKGGSTPGSRRTSAASDLYRPPRCAACGSDTSRCRRSAPWSSKWSRCCSAGTARSANVSMRRCPRSPTSSRTRR